MIDPAHPINDVRKEYANAGKILDIYFGGSRSATGTTREIAITFASPAAAIEYMFDPRVYKHALFNPDSEATRYAQSNNFDVSSIVYVLAPNTHEVLSTAYFTDTQGAEYYMMGMVGV
jgi:hypothetical protein